MTQPTPLRGFQRRHLRKLAHSLRPIVHVGGAGIAPPVITALRDALADHELVKVRLHEPTDKKRLAQELAAETGSDLCGLVGHTVILYKRNPDEPKIDVPEREV
jgi:RNA-binding protein